MADWDTSSPQDADAVNAHPANERAARAAVETNFGVDHHEEDDADVGKHEVIQLVDNAADPTITAGQVGVWNNGGALNTRVAGGGVTRIMRGEAGTKVAYHQATAPVGWTQDVTINDRVLRVVSGTGGGTGGSWTISGVTVDGHALTTSEMPVHNHSASTGADAGHAHTMQSAGVHSHVERGSSTTGGNNHIHRRGSGSPFNSATSTASAGAHTHTIDAVGDHTHSISTGNTGSGATHTHGVTADGAWRPSHADMIVCELD